MLRKFTIYCLLLFCAAGIKAQTDTVFWFAIPRITKDHPGSPNPNYPGGKPAYLRMSSLGKTNVTISMPANPSFTPIVVNFPSDTSISVDMSTYINSNTPSLSIENAPENTINNKGLLIKSDLNLITAYWDVDNYYNRDIFALKGKNALGTEFFCPIQNFWNNGAYAPEQPYSAIDIVATEDSTDVFITPSNDIVGHTKVAGTFKIRLNKGQSYSCRASSTTAAGHLGGTKITSNKPIAVTIKDDSVATSTSRDINGDQIVPVNIIGKEYIVMRGKVNLTKCNNPNPVEGTGMGERVFMVATKSGTTITANGTSLGTISAGTIINYEIKNNSTHIVADQPIYTYHVSGFGCETGGAILPKIEGCTGSKSVTIVKSKSDPFYLNIMTTTGGKNNLYMEYRTGGVKVIKPIPASNFEQVGASNWWVLKADKKQFDSLPLSTNVRVYTGPNGDRFHLGIINGNYGNACKYGYFSDYSEDRGSAVIGNNASDAYQGCYNDTIQLTATGGMSYKWKLLGSNAHYLNDTTIANPLANPPPGIYDYQVTIHRPCYPDTNILVKVEVAPQIFAAFEMDKTNACSPNTTIKFSNSSTSTNMEFYWDYESDNTLDTITTNINPFYHSFPVNNTKNPIVYRPQLLAINSLYTNCLQRISKTVTIYPTVDAGFTLDKTTGCNPLNVSFSNTSTGDTTTNGYRWDFGDKNTSSQRSPEHIFENLYSKNDTTYQIKLVATSNYYCKDSATASVTVRPFIDADFTVDTAKGCADFSVNISNNSKGGISKYNWYYGDGQTSTTSASKISKTYFNNTAGVLNPNLKLVVQNAGGCKDSLTRVMTVLPKVTASYSETFSDGCNPLTVSFTPGANITPVTYNWEFGDNSSSTLSSPTHTFVNNDNTDKTFTTSLTVTSSDFCTASFSNNITVHEMIKADFSVDQVTGCSGFTSTITNSSTGGISEYTMDYGDGTAPVVTIAKQSTYTHVYTNTGLTKKTFRLKLTVKNNNNCIDTLSTLITVYPALNAGFTINKFSGCNPLSISFSDTTNVAKVSQRKWEFGDGESSLSKTPTHIFENTLSTSKTFTPKLIITSVDGCVDTIVKATPVTVYPYIKSDFSVTKVNGCSPLTVDITNNSKGGISSRTWKYGDNVTNNNPSANFSYIYLNQNNNPDSITRTLRLIVQNTNGCKDSVEKVITVYPEVVASYSFLSATTGCDSLTVSFKNNSNLVASNYLWNFNDGTQSLDKDPTHLFSNTTNDKVEYNVKLTATSIYSCTNEVEQTVTVYPYIKADFTIDQATICSGKQVNFTNNYPTGVKHTYWDFDGNGSTEIENNNNLFLKALSYVDTMPGTINLMMVVNNGLAQCNDTAIKQIVINPETTASFSASIDSGCQPLLVSFINKSNIKNASGTIFSWDFGDGGTSSAKDTVHTFYNNGFNDTTLNVKLTVTSKYMCPDDTTININIFSKVKAGFELPSAQACSDNRYVIQNNSSSKQNFWDFDDNGSYETRIDSSEFGKIFINTDTLPKTIRLRLQVNNNHACYDTASKPIIVYPRVTSDFTIETPDSGCTPLTIKLKNKSNILNIPDTDFSWYFGDGSSTKNTHPTYAYNNLSDSDTIYSLKLTTTSQYNCSSTTSKPISVFSFIDADFSLPKSDICSDEQILFTNNRPAYENYWDFDGNGVDDVVNNSAAFNKTYTNYDTVPVSYSVRLVVKNQHACYDTAYQTTQIYPKVISDFNLLDPDSGCQPLFVRFENKSNLKNTAGTLFNWDFGDGNTSNDLSANHYFYNSSPNDTDYYVKLRTVSQYNCSHDTIKKVTAYAFIDAMFAVPKASECSGLPVKIYNNSPQGVMHSYWDFLGNGVFVENNQDELSNIYLNFDTISKIRSLKLKVQNNHNCFDSLSQNITVFPRVVSEFAMDVDSGCQPLEVQFINKGRLLNTPGTSFAWTFGDGGTSPEKEPAHIFSNISPNDTTYYVNLKTISQDQCSHDTTLDVNVFSFIDASFKLVKSGICSDTELDVTNDSPDGVTKSFWDFDGDLAGFEEKNEKHFLRLYTSTDTIPVRFNVTLAVKNNHACFDTTYKEIQIYPKVIADYEIAGVDSGCQPLNVVFRNKSNIVNVLNTKFNWNFGDSSSSGDKNPVHDFVNLDSIDKVFPVTLTTISQYQCQGSKTKNVSVFAYIDADFKVNESAICSDNNIEISNYSPAGATQFWWDYDGDLVNDNQESSKKFLKTYENTDTFPHNHNLRLIVSNNHACYDTLVRQITIYPRVVSDFVMSVDSGCQPLHVVFTNKSNLRYVPTTKYNWDFGDDNTSHLKNPDHFFSNLDSADKPFNVSLETVSQYLCKNTVQKQVTAFAYILADFKVDKSAICSNNEMTILNYSPKGVTHSYWDFEGEGNGIIENNSFPIKYLYTNEDTLPRYPKLKLVVKNNHQCFDSLVNTVTIYPRVISEFKVDKTEGCQPLEVNFTNKTNIRNRPQTKFYWDFGDGNTSALKDPVNIFSNLTESDRVDTVRLRTVSQYLCQDDTTVTIKSYAYIKADFSVPKADLCSDYTMPIHNNSPKGVVKNFWNFGDGYIDETNDTLIDHTYANIETEPVSYNLQLVVKNNHACFDTMEKKVTIYPRIVTDFETDVDKGCQPLKVKFQNTSNLAFTAGTNFRWTFGDSSSSAEIHPVHIFENLSDTNRLYPVTLKVTSKYLCESNLTKYIEAYSNVSADFKVEKAAICHGFPIVIHDVSEGGINEHKWDFGDGKSAINPEFPFTHVYENSSSSTIIRQLRLITLNPEQCSDTMVRAVAVYPKVTADFEFKSTGCSPLITSFENKSKNAKTYNWDFGDESSSSLVSPTKTFMNYGSTDITRTIILKAISQYQCSDSIKKTVTINHKPVAQFSVDKTIACPPFNVTFKNTSVSSNASYKWVYGRDDDTTTSTKKDVSHTFNNELNVIKPYDIQLYVTTNKGCKDTAEITINVYPKVTAKFDPVEFGCNPLERQFNSDKSINAQLFEWSFDDGAVSKIKNPTHVFFNETSDNKTFKVALEAKSTYGCSDSMSFDVIVYPAPKVNFGIDSLQKDYPNATYKFTNLTTPGPWEYTWEYGDDNTSNTDKLLSEHTYEHWGEYSVKLTAKYDKCIDSKVQGIILYAPKPIADFDSSVSGCTPVTVFFNNKSKWGNKYYWKFDDGTEDTIANPTHTFKEPGVYQVELTVVGERKGKDSSSVHYERVEVFPKPIAAFEYEPKQPTLPNSTVSFYNNTIGGYTYKWELGDGEFSEMSDPQHTYPKTIGSYKVKLVAFSEDACADSTPYVLVTIAGEGALRFPNAFTPNIERELTEKDNLNIRDNEIFYPFAKNIRTYHLEIYNRWGQLLFSTDDVNKGWNGYYKGQICKQDVYVYKATGIFLDGSTFEKAGDVTLLHKKK